MRLIYLGEVVAALSNGGEAPVKDARADAGNARLVPLTGVALIHYGPFVLLLAAVAAVAAACLLTGLPASGFMREPQTIAGLPWHAGLCSNLTALLWCAAAASALLGWVVLRERQDQKGRGAFLLHFGALTLALMLDDIFLLHEHVYTWYLGVPEKAVFAAYLAASLYGFRAHAAAIRATEIRLLASAFVFLGLSLFIDAFQYRLEEKLGLWRIFFEDGFKLLGAAGWLGWLSRAAVSELRGDERRT